MKKGLAILGAMLAVTVVTWALSHPTPSITFTFGLAQLAGTLALTGLAANLFIASRSRSVQKLFGSVASINVVHKWLGIGSVAMTLVHIAVFQLDRMLNGTKLSKAPIAHVAAVSILLFLGLVILALVAKKLTPAAWLNWHRLMLLAYVIGLVHYYGSSSYRPLGASPLSVWMDLVTLFAVCSVLALYWGRRKNLTRPNN